MDVVVDVAVLVEYDDGEEEDGLFLSCTAFSVQSFLLLAAEEEIEIVSSSMLLLQIEDEFKYSRCFRCS
eukprot:9268122-Ditylum_brightwellii.AAC.1